jgi:hypothetical protein
VPRADGAEWLGSAGNTVLVRCVCGAKLYLSRPQWARRSFTVCDDCKSTILYASLEVVDPTDAEEFIAMVIAQEEERELLREGVERELRRFVRAYDGQPEWLWSPATQKFVRAVRPKLELLGGPIGAQDAGRHYGVSQEAAYVGGEDGGPPADDDGDEDAPDVAEPDAA